jgi:hypothetical protein
MMDGSNFTKRKETNEEFWARVRKAREDHDEAVLQEHLAWMKRMEEWLERCRK